MPTLKYTANNTAWTKFTSGDASALVQLGSNGPVKIRKDSADPAPSVTDGIVMSRNTLGTISFDVLGGENLYMRSGPLAKLMVAHVHGDPSQRRSGEATGVQ